MPQGIQLELLKHTILPPGLHANPGTSSPSVFPQFSPGNDKLGRLYPVSLLKPALENSLGQPHSAGLKALLQAILGLLGKNNGRKAAVIGYSAISCHRAVLYIRGGAPDIPVWLFCTEQPLDETASLCERVVVRRGNLALLYQAQRQLWRCSVALTAGCWTGEQGNAVLKLAPLFIPPFRSIFLNDAGDFLSGTLSNAAIHCRRRLRERIHNMWDGLTDAVPAIALRIVSVVLGWLGYPDRRLFHWIRGRQQLWLPNRGATGFGVDGFGVDGFGVEWFSSPGNQWDGATFEHFAISASSRWIGWRVHGGTDCIDDMLPVMARGDSFAVSRQSSFRHWPPTLFATAPFRILQPGEASQVLAPLSGTLIVDRQKLLTLGVPKCRLAFTAWLLLFWKAAAAGWRSYSMGAVQPIGPEAEFPQEERAFILRALTNSSLRRLGPQEPDLSRGSIAFLADSRRGVGAPSVHRCDRLRVLVVSPFLPYPLSHGGAVRMFNLCRALSHRADFALVARHERGEVIEYVKLHEMFQEVRIVDIDEPASGSRLLPSQVRQHRSASMRAAVRSLSREWQPDLLQVEYTHMADFRDSAPEVPAILVEHDLTFSLYLQLAERQGTREARREYRRWLDYERHWIRAYDGVWTVSEDDRVTAIREGSRPDRTFTVPNGVDIDRFTPSPVPASNPEILYVGSFRHLPNMIGFEKLRDTVMPRVWSRCPKAVVRVVAGPDHVACWQRYAPGGPALDADPRVKVHGFVEDLRPLYAQASVVVVPLEVSAGTNIKVLEAMASGKAIVTTPAGCRGLALEDGLDVLIRRDWASFGDAIVDAVRDSALRSRLAHHARDTAERRFSWAAIQKDAYRSYLEVLGARSQ
jgi:glycosyltransferase involved in cell wall biosynthesis